jgi:hypothetical protein
VLAAVALTGVAATAAPAAATGSTGAKGLSGRTSVVTAPGIAQTLLHNGILPIVTPPGQVGLDFSNGLALRATFPVTGGNPTLEPLGGQVLHRGGIKFVNLRNGKALEVGNFTIDLNTGQLTGAVNRSATRVPVFTLDLSAATIDVAGNVVTITGVGLVLTDGAAAALNGSLGTSLFAGGLRFGSASSRLVL